MGSCSSVQRTQKNEETNTMKLNLSSSFPSKTNTLLIPPSPIKPNNIATFQASFTHHANTESTEEAFYDSKAWLESDGEDDFYSVKGEFTPSRGTSPVHHSFSTIPGPAATERKKKLLELFRESIREDKGGGNGVENNKKDDDKPIIQDVLLSKSANTTPYYFSEAKSACSERTVNSVKSKQCCLPSLVPCRSFSERRRKASPGPAITANGKA